MKRLLLLAGLALLIAAGPIGNAQEKKEAPVVPPRKGESKTIELFNGKDLDGWAGHFRYWSVVDGTIVGKSTEAGPGQHLSADGTQLLRFPAQVQGEAGDE